MALLYYCSFKDYVSRNKNSQNSTVNKQTKNPIRKQAKNM